MIDRLFRDTLSTWSTPGVALTYFSSRQLIVFSTSFGPSPGASVPTMSTGGVSSGKVSTLMRGVTTHAKTTRAMHTIKIAMGLRRERDVIGLLRDRRRLGPVTRRPSRMARPNRPLEAAHA